MGKPGQVRAWSPAREPTRGTETSKYPEERKSNETPSVAASERGIAQTILHAGWGCRTRTTGRGRLAERAGKLGETG
jgi:hypothetical protein